MTESSSSVDEIERHRAAVTRYLRYLIRDTADAEDLAQETFLRAHQLRHTLRDQGALESWLYQIATHASIDRMRQRTRMAAHLVDTPAEDLPISDEKRSSPFTIVQQQEMSTCVQQYVAKLSDAHKATLLLHDAEGMTDGEIAELLSLPITTVKMRLHRARRELQNILTDACAFGHDERNVLVCEPKTKSK